MFFNFTTTNARAALETGLKIEPNNHKAIFQLGNILLMEKNYSEAIILFDKSFKLNQISGQQ